MRLLLLAAAFISTVHASIVDPALHRVLHTDGAADIIVTMKDSTTNVLHAMEEATYDSRTAAIQALVEKLEAHTTSSQKSIHAMLSQASNATRPLFASYTSFWISNQLVFKQATSEFIAQLSTLDNIEEIRQEQVLAREQAFGLSNTSSSGSNDGSNDEAVQWNIEKIQAPEIWKTFGHSGQGIVVGHIDSGVRGTHELLRHNFRGAYGWYDPETKAPLPYDLDGHGTHTLAIIVGQNGYGVAPNATWMACKGCRSEDLCYEAEVLACAEFMLCPTDPAGNHRDCSKAPHLVSNSWGSPPGNLFFKWSNAAWHRAGIIPIFANGNNGPRCSTTASPAEYENVISVGATDRNDALWDYSSRGPSIIGTKELIKPDLVAPGQWVRSAGNDSDDDYVVRTGSSMAAPHVSGAIALLLSANRQLKYEQIKSLLFETADQDQLTQQTASLFTCGNPPITTFPNNFYGHGRVNLVTAMNKLVADSHPTTEPSASTSSTSWVSSLRDFIYKSLSKSR